MSQIRGLKEQKLHHRSKSFPNSFDTSNFLSFSCKNSKIEHKIQTTKPIQNFRESNLIGQICSAGRKRPMRKLFPMGNVLCFSYFIFNTSETICEDQLSQYKRIFEFKPIPEINIVSLKYLIWYPD